MLTFLSFFVALLCMVQCRAVNETGDADSEFVTIPPTTTNQTQQIGDCTHSLDGYIPSPEIGSAHKLHLWNLPWNNARRACYDEGGQLTIINSYLERDIVFRLMRENNVHTVWVGIHGLYEANDWTTVTGIPLAVTGYTGWSPGEPNNFHGQEHCGELSIGGLGGLNDLGCGERRQFICEIPITVQN